MEKDCLWCTLTHEDELIARDILKAPDDLAHGHLPKPDLIICPDDAPYLYRWHIVRDKNACTYFHIQVASDPFRPLHDHPWANFSVILSGGYDELWEPETHAYADAWFGRRKARSFRKGDTIYRKATEAHRLILPPDIPYTMTLFTTGPKIREWGFWYPEGWRPYTEVTRQEGNKSVHIQETADAG